MTTQSMDWMNRFSKNYRNGQIQSSINGISEMDRLELVVSFFYEKQSVYYGKGYLSEEIKVL